ncbi:MAG: glucokinase [Pseudomonadota bacterium]|nr:glucokinase [Pseudomonadota bacterium]
MMVMVLAGDIGATKTNLGLFSSTAGGLQRLSFCSFPSCVEAELVGRIKEFLVQERAQLNLAGVCFGVAGPVQNGYVEATNLGLKLGESELQKELGCASLVLVNDLYATAAAIPLLGESKLAILQTGSVAKVENSTAAILAPGTGLGMAFLVDAKKPQIFASEGGHADFSPRNEMEVELWRYLKLRYGRVSRERLLSGPGLVNIYDWLGERSETESLVGALPPLLSGSEKTAAAVVAAAENGEKPATQALEIFVALLGSVAGDLALIGMASGGLYLAGGIPTKIISHLRKTQFLSAFRDKGRMAPWLERIPVKVVLDPEAALLGAARIAFNLQGGDHVARKKSSFGGG